MLYEVLHTQSYQTYRVGTTMVPASKANKLNIKEIFDHFSEPLFVIKQKKGEAVAESDFDKRVLTFAQFEKLCA